MGRVQCLTLVLLLACGALPGIAAVAASAQQPAEVAVAEDEPAGPGASWGIEVLGVRRTAADYMLEFRYRVLDAEKAAYLMDRKLAPELIVEETGRKLQVPVSSKLGPLRQSPKFATPSRNYFMFFANPGRGVQAGEKVTVVIGEFKIAGLVVE